jgi:AraC-like DNA-binding protein
VIFSTDARRRRNAAGPVILDVFGLAFFFKLFSWLIGEPLRLRRVLFAHDGCSGVGAAADLYNGVVANLFGCAMEFGADCTALVFDVRDLEKPVVRTYRELASTLERVPVPLLPLPGGMSPQLQVEMIFQRALDANAGVPSLDQVADILGQSASTLRRNLLREDTSFQSILDAVRRRRALHLLRETQLTLDDISSMLGFSAPSVFSRAFKSWTGLSPSAYRAEG